MNRRRRRLGPGFATVLILLYLFAGLPLERVAATGIAHPGTNGEICFCVFALYREVEGSTAAGGCPMFFFGRLGRCAAGPGSLAVDEMGDLVGDHVPDGDQQRQVAADTGSGLLENCEEAGKEDQEEEDDGAGQNDAEDDSARGDAPARRPNPARRREGWRLW